MNIKNPNFAVNPNQNIFKIRTEEYENIKSIASLIVKPVEDIGFTINEIDFRDSRSPSGELNPTIKNNLVIRLQKGSSEIDISMFVPKLIDNNYFLINGRKKIPSFQLFDTPIVTRGSSVKLRTNIGTIMVFSDKEPPHIKVSFLGKKVSLALLVFSYFGLKKTEKKFNLKTLKTISTIDIKNTTNMYDRFLYDLKMYYDESHGMTQDDFILEVGRTYSKYNSKSKGEDIIYALDLIPKVDVFTKSFLKTPTILDELIYGLTHEINDIDYVNKRVRCFEYILFSKVIKAIFDLCISNRTTRQPKFNVNSTQILSDCNVSNIVQFDFSINPIQELTELSRISLLGPGGFNRDNAPKHLRDICDSMYGRVCPVDTPDRDNCGILQNILPNAKLTPMLQFSEEILDKQPVSIPVSFTPFLEHNDQTRLQMAASQMRQSIMLNEFESPMICSGSENLYTDQTQFVKKAKKNGEVLFVDNKFIIVVYDDKELDVINVYSRKIYVEHTDLMKVYVKVGDKIKAGDILAESNFCSNGEINFGRNLLTAVMPHYGNNYEDGIIISKKILEEGILTSLHFKDLSFTIPPNKVLLNLDNNKKFNPLPRVLDKLRMGMPYAILKDFTEDNFYSVFSEESKLQTDKDIVITDCNIFVNDYNDNIPEYTEWIQNKIKEQQIKEDGITQIINDNLPKEDAKRIIRENMLNKFSNEGKYKSKRERINGIRVELFGLFKRDIKVGDKLANRHGNKGIISRIVPQEKMPKLEDGRHADICINPLGIISRMNIGQLYELHLSMSLNDLKIKALEMLKNTEKNVDNIQKSIKNYLLNYIKIIDKTNENWYYNQFLKQMPNIIDENFINKLTLIQAPFESVTIEEIKEALKYTNTKFKQKIFDPISKTYIQNEIATGFIYFFKMVHMAESKLSARGIGAYARRTLQPLGGKRQKGGQRLGEMECSCLIGHDAPKNLFEFFTTKSDCIDLKNKYIQSFIKDDLIDINPGNPDVKPESVKLLNSYLTVIGVKY